MKGVWRGRKVPIVMFHQKFEKFDEVLEYDELEQEAYSNIKEVGIEKFQEDKRFNIEKIDSILQNVHRQEEEEQLYRQLKQPAETERLPMNIEKRQEFHIACMIFLKDNRLLIHEDQDRGLEFGCIKKIFGVGVRNWKRICEEGYKEKYNLSIRVEDCPLPVATYYYKEKNALGLIIMADYIGENVQIEKNWKIMTQEEISKSCERMVDNFQDNVTRAFKLRT